MPAPATFPVGVPVETFLAALFGAAPPTAAPAEVPKTKRVAGFARPHAPAAPVARKVSAPVAGFAPAGGN